jgi:nucleotide-binding universal stress UspA family protein
MFDTDSPPTEGHRRRPPNWSSPGSAAGKDENPETLPRRLWTMAQKILVAFDDSENALRAVDYVAKSFRPDNSVTLFSVLQDSAALCDMNSPELTPYFKSQQQAFCTLEEKKKNLVQTALIKAKDLLLEAGFKPDSILIKAEPKKKSVARDIADEADVGYDLIVLGRQGTTGLKDYFMGTIAQKVLHLAQEISVLIVY